MKLTKAPDSQYLKNRYVNEERQIEVGIWPVLYGWRVHAGKINDGAYQLDYCCGAKVEAVQIIQSLVISILEKNNGNWLVFPHQNIKPVFNDIPCFLKMIELAQEHEKVEVPDLAVLRNEIMADIFNEK